MPNLLPMKKVYCFILAFVCFYSTAYTQTPINISAQSNLTYTENFADINNWVFNFNPVNGTFTSGIGAAAWRGNEVNSTGTIPSATRITTLSNFFQTPPSGNGGFTGGVYKGSQSLVLLSTGTTDNTTSIAMDFFLNFTGVNANNLSFDWSVLNNSTGNRNGSLKVYASVDGVSYTEITGAQVLNFTNNLSTAGSISNIALPAIFNNSATARLRFYYHNGTGGTTGSRPRLNLDNVKVSGIPTTPCTTPTAQATNFNATTVINNAITFSFTNAIPAPQNYLVVISNNNTLSSNPINFTTYNIGDNLGDGNVLALTNNTTVTATGLNASTTYYFFIFSVNNSCTGGPLYLTINPLRGNATTLAGALPCVAPSTQPTALTFTNTTTSSISGSFTPASNTDEYLIVRSLSATFTGTLNNGTTYNGGNVLGNGTVVTRTAGTTFTSNSLVSGTQYYFYIFGLNNQNCTSGPVYNSSNPLTGNISTVALPICTTPTAQPTNLNLSASNTSISGFFTAGANADGYLVVRSLSSSLSATPVNGTNYVAGNTLGNGTVVSNTTSTAFIDIALTSSTTYHYFIFARNAICTGGAPLYLTTSPLTSTVATTASATYSYYYGNLHAHSSYSDGNQDNLTLTPADNYAYAKNSLCMDFLGISEHNHATAGMSINNWQPGLNQATAATTANFLALYGMEWGVISNGGHVLIYGTNQLIGWETNNYNIYVPKSNYTGTLETTGITGLFRTINNLGNNAFASFAHPSFSDFNNLSNNPFNATADSAVVSSAIASGIAFSTNTTYSDPPFSYGYIDYYNKMLSKGYHIGPIMDHDSHNTNFGRSSNNRLVTVMPSLTSTNFYTAMRGRNFYATEDCDTRVNFTLNNQIMGSIFSGTNIPAISIYATDPTNSSFTPTIRLMYGVPGSNVVPTQIAIVTASTLSYTDAALASGTTGYYFADITIAGNRTITSPIWYTKNAAVPVTLLSFNANINNNKTIQLNWKTTNEINSKLFVIERSENGVSYVAIDSMNAKNISGINNYSIIDFKPFDAINYYRLKQIDIDGTYKYSNVVSVNLKKNGLNLFSVYPNPVYQYATLNINSNSIEKVKIIITDMMGRTVLVDFIDVVKGNQSHTVNLQKLVKGNYQINLQWANETRTQKMVKL